MAALQGTYMILCLRAIGLGGLVGHVSRYEENRLGAPRLLLTSFAKHGDRTSIAHGDRLSIENAGDKAYSKRRPSA